jgi:hypothetical protein
MSSNNPAIQVIKYDFDLRKYFPNGFECRTYLIDDIWEYFVVFFDAENGGLYNKSAKWIAPSCGVVPTGNFIMMRKKWDRENEEENTIEMGISPKDFKEKYL